MPTKTFSLFPNPLKKIPPKPGVYLFLDQKGKPLYVGKAANLKNRLGAYLGKKAPLERKTKLLVQEAKKLKIIILPSEFEALLLEANLIKQFQPPYNTKLKDDKHYLYIKITAGKYPQVGVARRQTANAELFGPYPSAKTVRLLLREIRRIFPYRSCRILPPKPCLYYQINLCPAPCVNQDKKSTLAYQRQISQIKKLLEGKSDRLIKEYDRKMRQEAKKENFEKAAHFKEIKEKLIWLTEERTAPQIWLEEIFPEEAAEERLQALFKILKDYYPRLKLPLRRIEAYDIANISGREATGSMVVFKNGEPDPSSYRQFKIRAKTIPDDPAMIKEIVGRRLNHPQWPYPDLILVDGGKGQVNAAIKTLGEKKQNLPVVGLAKREEEIIIKKGNSYKILRIDPDSPALLLLRQARDEAHRFAQRYHHLLRAKKLVV
ncbi:GIY-YIG nuclease family protein [Candidatus Shapirobacteria bacterium]|nr:GIY-YIG nuclease family protein [Candidatus Shapirobacteria bacterium]